MDDSHLDFPPVPVRARGDGWTPRKQSGFIASLRAGLRPGAAARSVGMSRQTAYSLRARPGAEGFAAAWDAVCAAARRDRLVVHRPPLLERLREGELHPVRYRGRIVAMERRFDNRALMRLLVRTDKLIGDHKPVGNPKPVGNHGAGDSDYFYWRA